MSTDQKLQPKDLEELSRNTNFTNEEILEWYEKFLPCYADGHFQIEGIRQLYRQFYPFGDPSKFVDYVFRVFDSNNNGVIDFKEFLTVLHLTSHGTIEQKLSWSFRMYDVDGNGSISYDETLEIVKAIYKLHPFFETPEDSESAPEKCAKQLFRHLDMNNDGQVTLGEFIEGARKYPFIHKLL